MLKVAVAGSGYWGQNLVRNFNGLDALCGVCDMDADVLASLQKKYPHIRVWSAFDDLAKEPDIDAISIATPAETHFLLAKKALMAGKHVMIEKPMALLVEEAETLYEIAMEKGLILMVGHILLFHSAIITLRNIIQSGELGKINYIYSNRLHLGRFRTEENILWSFAPHDISAMIYLLGEMPETVMAHGGNYLHEDIADVTVSLLSFRSGVKGHLFVSWLHPYKEQKLIVVGDRKMAVFDDTLSEGKLQIHDKGVDWIARRPIPRTRDAKVIPVEDIEPLEAECRHFIDCIEKSQQPKTDGRHGVDVLKILDACQTSMRRNGLVVSLENRRDQTPYFVHDTSVLEAPCQIGQGTKIWHFSHVMAGAEIGERCTVGQNVVISAGVKIGNNVKIQNNVSVYEGVVLEDDVFCGPSMAFTNVINPRSHIPRKHEFRPTLVKKGATIGANATIVCGNTIGTYAFVGAGAVVTRDVPDYALMMGNPARKVGWMCVCGHRLDVENGSGFCSQCGNRCTVSAS